MQIITGKTGTPHVSAEADGALHAATFGTENCVLAVGSRFRASLGTNNTIIIEDGELLISGRHARTEYGVQDSVIMENGSQGVNRIDLIVARYKKVGDIESIEWSVIRGTDTTGTPTQPSLSSDAGDILEGAAVAEMAMFAIEFQGVSIVSITSLFKVSTGLDDVYRKNETYTQAEVNAIKQELAQLIAKAQSTADTAVQNAATAKNTADTAVQNAATAQNAADAAVKEETIITIKKKINEVIAVINEEHTGISLSGFIIG